MLISKIKKDDNVEVTVEDGQWMVDGEVFDRDYIEKNFERTSEKKTVKADFNLDEISKGYAQEWINDEDYIF